MMVCDMLGGVWVVFVWGVLLWCLWCVYGGVVVLGFAFYVVVLWCSGSLGRCSFTLWRCLVCVLVFGGTWSLARWSLWAFGLWSYTVSGAKWSNKAIGLWSCVSLELLVSGTGELSYALNFGGVVRLCFL